MSRYDFERIKAKLKFSKSKDKDDNDKGWRIRAILEIFRTNIQSYGYFQTALSVDETMVKSYARTSLKQFIRGKPIRFGLKFWALCTQNGFLLDLDLYCGKNSSVGDILPKCTLGTRVVMLLLKNFFSNTSPRKISEYHLYFDNFFTSFDLILHLSKLGLRSTGTIRENRVREKNIIDKNAPRGTYVAKHDKNSRINYITMIDSKQVSIASTAAGVNPLMPLNRYKAEQRSKVEIPFPKVFHVYNKFMGGVDLHDGHCNNVLPSIRSKRWTWVVFVKLIQSAITNATVLFNSAHMEENKIGTKEFVLAIAKHYIGNASLKVGQPHKTVNKDKQKKCSTKHCVIRTYKFCRNCEKYFCKQCFSQFH
ncbi:piggyBac transposable element-derived protein 3-like [Leptopilina heterotoma]|uniref:piggyBac transposable element-derived protein 3-like n=1 Tax=Leptopilina heterotoma TaxID=63436 RepID=UPI001CA9E3C1|nr:piggyBac transposable element-derived protein 3-like [Leptopilina heterotoma]